MACECMEGTATYWRHGNEATERMCSGTLSWILSAGAGVVDEGDVAFTSNTGTEWIWDSIVERLKIKRAG